MTTKTLRRNKARGYRFSINWPLWLGILFVGTIAYLAVYGPSLAPRDPIEENLIVKDPFTGKWHVPPFKAFTVTGFPLGSDEFGRDIYSRLLHAVRPTFQMVFVVAGVRLILGTLIGLVAGYSIGRIGSFFDTLISSALALPGLLVALGAIAIVGVELGVLAFVIGLSLTGWAETARLVREQTRTVRNEVYVEAAYAMGATDSQIVFRHVLRQIRSMLLMLLAFEVGSTLMLTAGLGFLGYYIGGDVWVDVADFVARRTSGSPELGQMLATAWVRLTDPWGLVSVGSVVFVAVLGFNLIGEGLRLRLSPEIQTLRIRWLSNAMGALRLNIAQAWHPVGNVLFGTRVAVTLWALLAGGLLGYFGVRGWQAGAFKLPESQVNLFFDESAPPTLTPLPGAAEGSATPVGSDSGSQTISAEPVETPGAGNSEEPFTMPTEPVQITDPVIVWTLEDKSGFAGHPAVDSEGNIYVASLGGEVYALNPDGSSRWQLTLDPAPAFSPVISGEMLFLPDRSGGLTALTLEGEVVWQYVQPDGGYSAVSQPVIDLNGVLYYTISRGTSGLVQAVGPDGSPLWRAEIQTAKFFRPPGLTAAGEYVFIAAELFDSATGEPVILESAIAPDSFFVGTNGKNYMVSGPAVFEWQRSGSTMELLTTIRASGITEQFGGVASPLTVHVTEDNLFIFVFGGFVLWQNELGELLFETHGPDNHFLIMPVSLEDDLSVIVCGRYRFSLQDPLKETCLSLTQTGERPAWKVDFGEYPGIQDTLTGGTRTPSGFIFASRKGFIYGVMERSIAEALEEQQANAAKESTAITATGSGWIFKTPSDLLVEPLLHENETVYLLTTDDQFYVLDSDGAVLHTFALPEPVYVLQETLFGGGTVGTAFPPILAQDGSIVVASDTRLYAITLDGTLNWEIPLDAAPHSPPITGLADDTYYLLDSQGSLYAFTPSEGLLWKHDLEEGLRPAFFFPVFSSTGDIFYTITNGTRGQIEALGPDGTQRWRTPLQTFNFYRPIQITPAGDWISVDDNVVRSSTGELVELVETEFPIDQFAMGRDGKTYLMSGSTVMEWTLLPGGHLNIERQVTIAFPPNATRGLPPRLSVTEDGTIWIVFVQAGGRSIIYDWVTFGGEVLNQITVDLSESFVVAEDTSAVNLTLCTLVRAETQLVCRGYVKRQLEPLWEITIQGIPRADNIHYSNGVLYIQTASDTLQTVSVDFPTD